MTVPVPGRVRSETSFAPVVVVSLLVHLVLLTGAALYEATPRKRLYYSNITMVDLLPGAPGSGSGRGPGTGGPAQAATVRSAPVAPAVKAPARSVKAEGKAPAKVTKAPVKAAPVAMAAPQKASRLPPIAPIPVGPPRQAAVARPTPAPPAVPLGDHLTRLGESLGKQAEPRREPAREMPREAPAGSADVARQLSRLESAFSKATQASAPATIPREPPATAPREAPAASPDVARQLSRLESAFTKATQASSAASIPREPPAVAPTPSAAKVAERLSEIKGRLREASSNIIVRTGGEGDGGEGGGQGGAGGDPRFTAYYDELYRRIKEGWFVSEIDLQRTRRPAILSLRLGRDGKLLLADFEERSGNPRFDQSALRAVYKAAPFPPLPAGLGGAYLDVGVRFRPEDYGRQG
ncbi:MAG: TonB family protein [Deltaproteobacteria bacterium]|nr:TonB family protein [Deltaproteobacteria bacterium]MBI3079101.1 TonB family protein [Deltaproteobacteria bacterium]